MRKRWTPREDITEEVLTSRERQKWQIALRRYLIEQKRSPAYAPYFGLDISTFREWIEIQFTEDMNWSNFSAAWKLDYVIPLSYFDLANPNEMKLGCNFINIRVEPVNIGGVPVRITDLLTAKSYFIRLFKETGYPIAGGMVDMIEQREALLGDDGTAKLQGFIKQKAVLLTDISSFSVYQFEQLNMGMTPEEIIEEQELLNKMGSSDPKL